MKIHENIYRLRVERGWSQRDLAERLGISKTAVHYYEKGKIKPSFDMLCLMEEVFNVDLPHIIGSTDKVTLRSPEDAISTPGPHYLEVTLLEIDLVSAFRHATPDTQAAIRAILHLEG